MASTTVCAANRHANLQTEAAAFLLAHSTPILGAALTRVRLPAQIVPLTAETLRCKGQWQRMQAR